MQQDEIVLKLTEFIEKDPNKMLRLFQMEKHFILDFDEIRKFDYRFQDLIIDEPNRFFSIAEPIIKELGDKQKEFPIRIKNFHTNNECASLQINYKRIEHVGKMWWFRGTVRTISEVKPLIVEALFECPSCGNKIIISQLSKYILKPHRCGCGNKKTFIVRDYKKVNMVKLVLEEEFELMESGQNPQRLNVLLTEGLTTPEMYKLTLPGKRIIITGILKDIPISIKDKVESTEREWLLIANYIEPLEDEVQNIEITKDDIKTIIKLSKDENIYQKFISSIAPNIYGYNNEKLALILQAFEGIAKYRNGKLINRGKFHIIFVGDPATSKTKIAKGLIGIIPKGKYSSGSHASGGGLTWTAEYDEFIGAWTVQAGTLVLASGGLAIIDEADKIREEHLARTNEALEDMCIHADKASIHETLRAECSVLFIANPKQGRFTPYSGNIFQEFELDPSLISRASLIFVFRQETEEGRIRAIAQHIYDVHSKIEEVFKTELNELLIKKYIIYAKKNCFPSLPKKLKKYVEDKFVELVKMGNVEGRIAFTFRQFEDILRLSEAHAKVRLSNEVSEKDIDAVFDLMMYSIRQHSLDSTGRIDTDTIELGGKTYEVRNKNVIFMMTLKKMIEDNNGKSVEIQKFVNLLSEKGISEVESERMIELRKKEGECYEPRRGMLMVL